MSIEIIGVMVDWRIDVEFFSWVNIFIRIFGFKILLILYFGDEIFFKGGRIEYFESLFIF